MLTAEQLRDLLHYDPETGQFTWKDSVKGRMAGQRAGCLFDRGYRRVRVNYRFYAEHRLVWLYVTGEWPRHQIDHINGQRDDNRIANLRDVCRSTNAQNQRKAVTGSATGVLGVQRGYKGQFNAYISDSGRSRYLGTYPTPEEAHKAYLVAKRAIHPGCTL